jgi:putative aldouronate transport system substrate-binding protein
MQLGIKGEHWIEKEDGSIEFTQKVWDKAEEEGLGIQMARNYFGMGRNCPNGIPDMRAYEAMNVTQDRIDCIETYESGIIIPKFPPVVHTPAEDEVINDKFTEIRTFVEEQIDLFVMGSQELTDDKWDWYIESIKDSGLAEVVAVKQSAYDRYKDKSK